MTEYATTHGLDLGDKKSEICVLDSDGEIVAETRIPTTKKGIWGYFGMRAPSLVVLEAGTHSPWVSRMLEEAGHEVVVANPRQVRLISGNVNKGDRVDANLLARLGRADRTLLSPIRHRSAQAQQDLVGLRARAALVRVRAQLVVSVRNLAKAQGVRIPSGSCASFHKRARATLHATGLLHELQGMLVAIEQLTEQIRESDARLEKLCQTKYPEAAGLMQIPGVGLITVLTFILTLEDPERFRRNRSVGSYLGLTPRRRQSGERDPRLGISKAGDPVLRALLVQCAHHILGRFGKDSALRRKGERIASGGGKGAKKRAVVAVARQLACVLHRLWRTGEDYVPFPDGVPAVEEAAA